MAVQIKKFFSGLWFWIAELASGAALGVFLILALIGTGIDALWIMIKDGAVRIRNRRKAKKLKRGLATRNKAVSSSVIDGDTNLTGLIKIGDMGFKDRGKSWERASRKRGNDWFGLVRNGLSLIVLAGLFGLLATSTHLYMENYDLRVSVRNMIQLSQTQEELRTLQEHRIRLISDSYQKFKGNVDELNQMVKGYADWKEQMQFNILNRQPPISPPALMPIIHKANDLATRFEGVYGPVVATVFPNDPCGSLSK